MSDRMLFPHLVCLFTILTLISSLGAQDLLQVEEIRPDQMADLVAQSLKIESPSTKSGQIVKVALQIRNRAFEAAKNVKIVLYLDHNEVYSTREDVSPNSVVTVIMPWRIAGASGNWLTAIIDPDEELIEIERLDNTASVQFAVSDEPLSEIRALQQDSAKTKRFLFTTHASDLRIEGLSIYAREYEARQPRDVTVSFRVVNDGDQGIEQPFQVNIIQKQNSNNLLDQYHLSIPELPAGESVYVSRTIRIDVDSFRVDIEVDEENNVNESDEENNRATGYYKNPTPNVGRWVSIGPRKLTSGLGATGRLHAIAIHPSNPAIIYVGSPPGFSGFTGGSGVWKTTDGGSSWQPIADALPTLTITAISIDPSKPSRVYVLTPNGLFKTENAGTSWTLRTPATALDINRSGEQLIVHPSNPDILYVTTNNGVYRSSDRGISWQVSLGGARATDLVMNPTDPANLYAALSHPADFDTTRIYETRNGGQSWKKMHGCPEGALPAVTERTTIKLAISDNRLYASFKNSSSWTLYRTTELGCAIGSYRGQYWEPGWKPTGSIGNDPIYKRLWNDIYVDPEDPKYVYATGTDFWISDNHGESFTRVSGPHADHHGFATDPNSPKTIFTVCDGGIYRSSDRGKSGTWSFIGEGITNVEFYDIADAPTNPDQVIGGTQDNGTLKYNGSSTVYRAIRGGDGATVDIDPKNDKIIYAGGQNISIERSTDGGNSFSSFRSKQSGDPNCFNPHYEVHPTKPNLVLESCGSLWQGLPWVKLFTPQSGTVARSAIDPTVNLYYAGTSRGELYAGPNGGNWRKVFSTTAVLRITDIEIDPANPKVVYVSNGGSSGARVYRLQRESATPSQMTATDISSNLPSNIFVRALAIDRMNDDTIYAGTNQGAYRARSFNSGTTWTWDSYNNGMPAAVDISELEVHPTTGVLRAATFGRSAFEVNTDSPVGSTLAADGKVIMLRAHNVGTKYGPPTDQLDVEVVVKLDSDPDKAFGFKLRNDTNELAHRDMLNLLRDAFNNNRDVQIEYVRTGIKNGRIIRVINNS